jgi:lipoprotein-anchoring transpeptidase ErfK/SrfK
MREFRGVAMSVRGTTTRAGRLRNAAALSAVLLLAVAGCSSASPDDTEEASAEQPAAAPAEPEPVEPAVTVSDNVRKRNVPVDTTLEVSAQGGTLKRVRVTGGDEQPRVFGKLNPASTKWTASSLLEDGQRYTVKTVAVDAEGRVLRDTRTFRTDNLSLDEQTYPSIAPLEGDTVGVGMPIQVLFDIPVKNRAAMERHLSVESTPEVQGSWHWYSDSEVHFRPREYWKPGSKVTVHADVNSVDAGNGVYGQLSRTVSFNIGRSVVSKIHVKHHFMDVFINGKHARRIQVSAGAKNFETRSGTKVVMQKYEVKRMDARTVGIQPGDPEYYNIPNVRWALRVTDTGEFVHGAPWSIGDQGEANVSHGCVGMSLSDARWLYNRSHVGDIVKVYGTDRGIERNNGWTDWDVSWAQYKKGSALS